MAEQLYALGDIGATNLRVGVYNGQGECVGTYNTNTHPDYYEDTVHIVADTVGRMADGYGHGKIVAASMAVAAEVNENGELTRAGGLSPWIGRNLGQDMEIALGLPSGLVGTPNDVVAIAISQQNINLGNGRPVKGIATTLSSGWGGALYWEADVTKSDEPGHEHLRFGAMCPCGQEGHAEAYVSGNGVMLNHGVDMQSRLEMVPDAQQQLVTDLSTATIAMIERHRASGFDAEEIRWTGGIALGQPFIIFRVANEIRYRFGDSQPIAIDTITMGEQAGIHGTFIDAQRRAVQY